MPGSFDLDLNRGLKPSSSWLERHTHHLVLIPREIFGFVAEANKNNKRLIELMHLLLTIRVDPFQWKIKARSCPASQNNTVE